MEIKSSTNNYIANFDRLISNGACINVESFTSLTGSYLVRGQRTVSGGVPLQIRRRLFHFARVVVLGLGLLHLGQVLGPRLLGLLEQVLHLLALLDVHHRLVVVVLLPRLDQV